MSAEFPIVIPDAYERALRKCESWGPSGSKCVLGFNSTDGSEIAFQRSGRQRIAMQRSLNAPDAKRDEPRMGGRSIQVCVHLTLAAVVLIFAYAMSGTWLAMLDIYVRAFLSSNAFSLIC